MGTPQPEGFLFAKIIMKSKNIALAVALFSALFAGCGEGSDSDSTNNTTIVAPSTIVQLDFVLHETTAATASTLSLASAYAFKLTRPGITIEKGVYSPPVRTVNTYATTLYTTTNQTAVVLNFSSAQAGTFTLTPSTTNAFTGTFTTSANTL